MPLVSVIIPIYKVEPYLRRCLDSIVSQTYTNLEIILVDDGSPDNCPQICDEYAANDKRIVVIHKENGGLSDARNAGLDICKGDYVSFVDSDDWVDEKYVEILLKLVISSKADIAIGENDQINGVDNKLQQNFKIQEYTSKESLHHLFTQNHMAFITSWGKIYRKDLFFNLFFPTGKYHEDEFTTYILYYRSKKIVYTNDILYYYFRRSNSITGARHPWDVLDYLEQRYLFFKEKKEIDLLSYLLPPLCWQLLCAYWDQTKRKQKESAEKYLGQFRYYMKDAKITKMSLFQRISLSIFSCIPQLYLIYRKISPLHIRKEF